MIFEIYSASSSSNHCLLVVLNDFAFSHTFCTIQNRSTSQDSTKAQALVTPLGLPKPEHL